MELFDRTASEGDVRQRESGPESVQPYDAAIDGRLSSLSGDGDGATQAIPEDLKEHLRALGYAE